LTKTHLKIIGSNQILIGGFQMWIITLYLNGNIKMFEFDKEEEANEAFKNIQGTKFLSKIVYFNDPSFV
jgi:ArsR family metal-binding transcriptional regulator